ncbi:hypothetical protein ASPNIDRAFT_44465, partial [Aspergillus niger ATCC 1015]
MASEPTEEAIANFVSFTSSTREQAISFLKDHRSPTDWIELQANNLNSNQAINAYFEDPTGPQTQMCLEAFQIEHADPAPGSSITAPSRPPSTLNSSEHASGAEYQHSAPVPTQAA